MKNFIYEFIFLIAFGCNPSKTFIENVLIIKITISTLVIGLKKVLFSTNSLAKLLSDSLSLDSLLLDSLLSDSSMSQSHSKMQFGVARTSFQVFDGS